MALIFDEIQGKVLKIGRDDHNLIDFSTDNQIIFRLNNSDKLLLSEARLAPNANDGMVLGSSSLMWSDLFLASGAVINFNNGDITLTHSSNVLELAGGLMRFVDNSKATFGNSNDLQIYHDGTDNHIDATSALNLATGTSGVQVNIGHTTSEVVVNDNLTVTGDLTIVGSTIMQSTTNTTISDTIIRLNDGVSGTANTSDTGLMFNRGTSDRVFFGWDESVDKFIMVTTSTAADAAAGNVAIANDEAYQTLVANIQAPLTATVGGNNVMTVAGGTFTGNVTAPNLISSGYVKLGADERLISDGSVTVHIDYNNNQTDRSFKVRKDNSADVFTINEDGTSAFTGKATITTTSDSKLNLRVSSGDDTEWNYIDFTGSNGTRDAFIGVDSDGDPQWYRDNNAVYLRLDSDKVYSSHMLKVNGELEATSLDINGNADISGNLTGVDSITASATVQAEHLYSTDDLVVDDDATVSGDLTVSGITYGLYHSTTEDGYYFDDYNGSRNLSMVLKNQRADIIRYQPVDNFEYWNGSAWVADASQEANVKKLLDGRQDTSWSVPSTYYKFRFTTKQSTGWPTRANIGIQTSWSGSTWPGCQMLVEHYASSAWATHATMEFGGSSTALNSNDNGIDNWGLMFKSDSALHDGDGDDADSTRITIDFYGWSPSNGSYTTIPLQNIFITSNYAGTENTDYTNLLSHDTHLRLGDSRKLILGAGEDMHMYHDGTNSYIHNDTGDLRIENDTTDGDIIFRSDNGSGGLSTYFRVDGGLQKTIFPDNQTLAFGSVGDLSIYHDASNSFISNGTGDLYFINGANDKDIIFQCDDGSGGLETYFYLDGSASSGDPYTVWPDNSIAAWGTDVDLRIQHDGSTASIFNTTGHLQIINYADDKDIIFKSDDGSGGVTTYFSLDGSVGGGSTVHTVFPDNSKAVFGTGLDTQIWHDGTNSYIKQQGGGNLIIQQTAADQDIILQSDDGSGGETAYITLDGSATTVEIAKATNFASTITHAGSNESSGNIDKRNYYCTAGSGGGNFLIGQIETSANADGAIAGTVYFAYDYGTTSDNPTIHFNFAQRSGTARGTWWYEGDDQDAASDRVSVKLIDDGSGNMYVWVVIADYAKVWVETRQRQINSAISSGQLTSGTVTTGTTLFDTADNPTAEMHIGKLEAHDDVNVSGALTVGVDDTGHDVIFYGATSGRYLQWDESADKLLLRDSTNLVIGNGSDLQLYHNGSTSFIYNNTGNLEITNAADDSDIIFKSDDGSGGVTEYFRLDGGLSATYIARRFIFSDSTQLQFGNQSDTQIYNDGSNFYIDNITGDQDIIFKGTDDSSDITALTLDMSDAGTAIFNHDIKLADNGKAFFGGGTDLSIYHDGSNSYILQQTTGDLIIQNSVDDKDIIFKSDDGSGGVENYIQIDGSTGRTLFNKHVRVNDNVIHQVGSAADMQIYHNGTHSYILNGTGDLEITNNTDDGDIIFKSDDGSGGTTTYFKLDGGASQTVFSKHAQFVDGQGLLLGSGTADLQIIHNGTDSYISNDTGDLIIQQKADDKDIIFKCDDGSGDIETYFFLDGSASSGNPITIFPDLSALYFGTGTDLLIRHDGTDSTIANNGGDFYITQNTNDKDLILSCDDGSNGNTAYITLDGSNAFTQIHKDFYFLDSVKSYFGSDGDSYIRHTGSNFDIINSTGNINITNNTDDGDIIFKSDDGSGGTTAYLTLDGGVVNTYVHKDMRFEDSVKVLLGTGGDVNLYHDGSNMTMINSTGSMAFYQSVDDGDMVFYCDDGSGGLAAYLTLDGSSAYTKAHKHILYEDDAKAMFGTGGDMQILHDGSNSYISQNVTGELYIENNATDGDVIFRSDDGSGGTTTYFKLDGGNAQTEFERNVKFLDTIELRLGTSNDLRIYHDSNNNFIDGYGGHIYIRNTVDNHDIVFQTDDGSGGYTAYLTIDGSEEKVVVNKPSQRTFAKSSTTDGDANGDIVYFGGTTSMEVGKIYYLNSSGNWALTDADAEATAKGMLAVALGSASDTDGMLIRGMVTLDHDPGTVGDVVFLSTTAGQASSTAPSGNGDIVRVVGYCLDSSNGQIYFNPDGTFVEVTA